MKKSPINFLKLNNSIDNAKSELDVHKIVNKLPLKFAKFIKATLQYSNGLVFVGSPYNCYRDNFGKGKIWHGLYVKNLIESKLISVKLYLMNKSVDDYRKKNHEYE